MKKKRKMKKGRELSIRIPGIEGIKNGSLNKISIPYYVNFVYIKNYFNSNNPLSLNYFNKVDKIYFKFFNK